MLQGEVLPMFYCRASHVYNVHSTNRPICSAQNKKFPKMYNLHDALRSLSFYYIVDINYKKKIIEN